MQSILIVDDLESIHEMLEAVIQPIGFNTVFATDGETALEKLRQETFEIVLTDINMTPMDGLTLLGEIRKIDPDAVVLMMSGFANVENATEALKLGAFDFLTKPFKVDQLMASINRAAVERKKRREAKSNVQADLDCILTGTSEAAKKLTESVKRHAKSKTPLLITGETGTQKSAIASIIHGQSEGSDHTLVTIDARKLDEHEFYAQLHTPDGVPSEIIESAKGGTLFIANIDRVALATQAKLGNLIRDLKGQVRVICSSSRDLDALVEAGEFEDVLFFRIATSVIEAPALRDRSEDLPAMVMAYFAENGLTQLSTGSQATALLGAYQWPGNYAELKETLDAAAETVGTDNVIHKDNLPEKLSDTSSWPTLAEHLEAQASRYRAQVLKACQGDSGKAAQVLGE